MLCHVCKTDNGTATYPDPCCNASDCEHKLDVVHYQCASRHVKREIESDTAGSDEFYPPW